MIISNKKLLSIWSIFFGIHSLALHCEGMVNEFWKNDIHSDYGVPANIRISAVRRTIFRKLQNQELLMLGSISKHGICSTDLQESLRDIQACLRAAKQKTYHMGIRGKISRNTLSHANQTRDWRIYADFAQALIRKARNFMPTIHSV